MRAKSFAVDTAEAGRLGAKKRWEGKTIDEKRAETAKARAAASAYWDALSPEERSAEMKKRAAKRKKKPTL